MQLFLQWKTISITYSDCVFVALSTQLAVFVGLCQHGMARPRVADGGTASDMEGSSE